MRRSYFMNKARYFGAVRSLSRTMSRMFLVAGLATTGLANAKPADAGQIEQPSSGPLKHLSLQQLGDVEVTTASKEPEQVWRTPAAIYFITQEDIRRSGATSLPEVLRLAPGVEVARVDSDHWSIGIRGFGAVLASKLLVLIDGRSIYSPLFAGVYWEVQATPLQDIERIEVIRGPGGTIWGANAVDGVINIITKNASATHGSMVSVGRATPIRELEPRATAAGTTGASTIGFTAWASPAVRSFIPTAGILTIGDWARPGSGRIGLRALAIPSPFKATSTVRLPRNRRNTPCIRLPRKLRLMATRS